MLMPALLTLDANVPGIDNTLMLIEPATGRG
jgi:hypothetical protein